MNLMKKNSQITIRISDEFHDKLRRLAEEDRRPVASYVAIVLERHVEEKLGRSDRHPKQ